MSSTIYQPNHSCLDPFLLESRSLIHQLAPSKQDLSLPWPQKLNQTPASENQNNSPIEKAHENNGKKENPINVWNLMQSLTKPTNDPEPVYVHPLLKRSTSFLNTKSLEMCTESLGSETGTGIDSNHDSFSNLVLERKQSCRPKTRESFKKMKQNKAFPPPLTSINGNDGVQVKTHREEGRLVIKAFNYSSCSTYFKAERENGRLRLSLFKDENRVCGENEEGVEEENVDDEEEGEEDKGYNGNFNGCIWGENRKDDGKNVGCVIGGGEWGSTSNRCNGDRGGGKSLPSLPFCVAIS